MGAFLFLLVLFIGGAIAWSFAAVRKEEREKERAEVLALATKAQAQMDKVNRLKTTTAQVNACGKALGYLVGAEEYSCCREVIENYDELLARLRALKKVLPIVGHVEKANKHRFKGKDASEKNALLDALYEIETYKVTDEEVRLADLMPDGMREPIEIEGIRRRLRELGWEGP